MTPTVVDLFASALHFHPDGEVRAAGRQMAGGAPGIWHLGAFHVETDADVHADHWEMHPEADEAVCCLTGGARLHLRPADGDGRGAGEVPTRWCRCPPAAPWSSPGAAGTASNSTAPAT